MFKRNRKNTQTSENVTSVSLKHLLTLRVLANRLTLDSLSKVKTLLSGGQDSHLKGRGIDFAEVRQYQAGDDIRHIDWRVTARTSIAHTKIFQEERERPIYLIVDYNPSMFFGSQVCFKSVLAAKIATLYAWAGLKHHDRIGAFIFSGKHYQEFPLQRGTQTLPLFLDALSDTTTSPTQHSDLGSLANVLERLQGVVRPGSLIIVCSDFYELDNNAKQHFSQLSIHNDVIVNFIYDPLEASPPPADQYAISDGMQTSHIDTRSSDLCKSYRAHFARRVKQIKQLCHKRRICFFMHSTKDDVIDKLVNQGEKHYESN